MQVFYRNLGNITTLILDEYEDVNDVKTKIEDFEFIPANLQKLLIGSRYFENGLVKDNLQEGDTIEMMLELKGGMRAKWKKKRMRRLKRNRRRMRQRRGNPPFFYD